MSRAKSEIELRQLFGAGELDDALSKRCEAFLAWSRQEAGHRAARDLALTELAFPEQDVSGRTA
jgi:hypothetical protein